MNQPTHTPDPWVIDAERDIIFSGSEESMHSLICKLATGENRAEEDANARLIAAAPDLLEALKEIIDRYTPSQDGGVRAVKQARAAIAKAEGPPSQATEGRQA